MKIGIAANIYKNLYQRWGEDKYKKLKNFGYDAVDYDMSDTNQDIYSCTEEEFKNKLLHERKLADDAGIEIHQVHGPWRWPARDFLAEDRAERMEKMKKSIRGTAIMGCKYWVIHPIMPHGTEDIGTGNEQETWDMNLEFMSELLKTAKEFEVVICFENMPMHKFSLATPSQILKFVKTINDDNFKICLDTGHVSVFPKLNAGDAVRELGKEIKVLHVHDNRFERDLHLMPYFGIIDWEDFAKSLDEIGFEDVFSLESVIPDKLLNGVYEDMYISLAKIARDTLKNNNN